MKNVYTRSKEERGQKWRIMNGLGSIIRNWNPILQKPLRWINAVLLHRFREREMLLFSPSSTTAIESSWVWWACAWVIYYNLQRALDEASVIKNEHHWLRCNYSSVVGEGVRVESYMRLRRDIMQTCQCHKHCLCQLAERANQRTTSWVWEAILICLSRAAQDQQVLFAR